MHDRCRRCVGRSTAGDQLCKELLEISHPHQDDERIDRRPELSPARLLRHPGRILVARHDREGRGMPSIGDRNAGIREGRHGRCDTGDDLEGNPCRRADAHLLATPTKHEGIAALESDDGSPGKRMLDEKRVDVVLTAGRHVMSALADVDEFCAVWRQVEQLGRRELVIEDDVGPGQHPGTADRDQIGIAGTGTDQ